jgi:hypothetical protein
MRIAISTPTAPDSSLLRRLEQKATQQLATVSADMDEYRQRLECDCGVPIIIRQQVSGVSVGSEIESIWTPDYPQNGPPTKLYSEPGFG